MHTKETPKKKQIYDLRNNLKIKKKVYWPNITGENMRHVSCTFEEESYNSGDLNVSCKSMNINEVSEHLDVAKSFYEGIISYFRSL